MTTQNQTQPRPVIQDWVTELPFMQQTVLMAAVRGPDGTPKYGPVKMLMRYYRRCVLVSSLDGIALGLPFDRPGTSRGGSFMGPSIVVKDYDGDCHPWELEMDKLMDDYLRTLDALPHHFQLHFMHAAQIVGYKYPAPRVAFWWFHNVYLRLVRDMHLNPESMQDMNERLGDSREQWLKHADHATTD